MGQACCSMCRITVLGCQELHQISGIEVLGVVAAVVDRACQMPRLGMRPKVVWYSLLLQPALTLCAPQVYNAVPCTTMCPGFMCLGASGSQAAKALPCTWLDLRAALTVLFAFLENSWDVAPCRDCRLLNGTSKIGSMHHTWVDHHVLQRAGLHIVASSQVVQVQYCNA